MRKERLFDCCGAYHINRFDRTPDSQTTVTTWNGVIYRDRVVTALQALELMSGPHGNVQVPGHPTGIVYTNSSPGILSCVLTANQNYYWAPHLLRLGWTLVANNINNRNSGNQLFFYVKVSNYHRTDTVAFRFADGVPYTGRAPRVTMTGGLSRVRHPVTGELQPVEGVPLTKPRLVL